MIRARLANGELTTYIGPDPNGGHVIRHDNGDMHTVDQITPEFGPIRVPQIITSIYQGPIDGIGSWPDLDTARRYQADQARTYGRMIPLGQIIEHRGLVILADTTGTPLKAGPDARPT